MRTLFVLLSIYPRQSIFVVLALLGTSVVEGVGVAVFLPLLNIATYTTDQPAATETATTIAAETTAATDIAAENYPTVISGSEFSEQVIGFFRSLGIEPSVTVLLITVVLIFILKNLILFFTNSYIGSISVRLQTDLRLRLLRAVMSSRWIYFVRQPVGKLVNTMSVEIVRAASSYTHALVVIALMMTATVYVSIAFLVFWQATLFALISIIGIWIISRRLLTIARKAGKRQTTIYKSLMSRLTDILQAVKMFKAMAKERFAKTLLVQKTNDLNRALYHEVVSSVALSSVQESLLIMIIAFGIFVALIYLHMPLTAVITLVLLLSRMLVCIGKIQKSYQKLLIFKTAYWSTLDAIAEAEQEREWQLGKQAPQLTRSVRLDDVSFAYKERLIFSHLSLVVPVGEITMLLGASGAGKTTIVDLVTGLHQPQQGKILADDVDIKQIDLAAWRQGIGYVPQESILLHDTIFNNLTFGDSSFTEQDALEALEAAQALAFIEQFPDGIHAVIGERGLVFSGGQRQRIMIARALIQKPTLLILDEATSSLDPENEQNIFSTLVGLKGTITILIVSHRPSLTPFADHIYELSNGVLRQQQRTEQAFAL